MRVIEKGAKFELDFEKVYWCSRLQQERDRLLTQMKPGETLLDIFCGVGPLAVRAALKGLIVLSNDLNPYCTEFLINNCRINKVSKNVLCWNLCARAAMRKYYS